MKPTLPTRANVADSAKVTVTLFVELGEGTALDGPSGDHFGADPG
jgi:hypothetical protein